MTVLPYIAAALVALGFAWWAWIAPLPEGTWEAKTREARGNIAMIVIIVLILAAIALPRLLGGGSGEGGPPAEVEAPPL